MLKYKNDNDLMMTEKFDNDLIMHLKMTENGIKTICITISRSPAQASHPQLLSRIPESALCIPLLSFFFFFFFSFFFLLVFA